MEKISIVVLAGGDFDKELYQKCKESFFIADPSGSEVSEIIEVKPKNDRGSFADWRNEGLKKAKYDWILYIDTDEEITPKLRLEINQLINQSVSQYSAYAIPRRNFIFGQEFKHGGQWPDYQKRLFQKNKLIKWTGDLHEEPEFSGKLGHLNNPLIHHKNITLSQMVDKTNRWSEIEGMELYKSNHPKMNFFRFASAGFREFWLRFVRQLCFLDGTKGVIYGMYQIYSRLISYSKLWELQLKNQ